MSNTGPIAGPFALPVPLVEDAAAAAAADPAVRAADEVLARNLREAEAFAAKVPKSLRNKVLAALQQRARAAWILNVSLLRAAGGYAPRAAAPAAPRPSPSAPPAASSSSGKGEWSFLDDRRLSIEEKLFRFMKLAMKKSDDALQAKMKEYRDKFVENKGGGILGGIAKAVSSVVKSVAPLDLLVDGLQQFAKVFGGPALGALVTALGMPQLAPVALKLGGEIGSFVASQLDGGSAAQGSGGSGSSKSKEAGSPDERLMMMELQRMVEKQNQMFATVSNILKATHEASMNAIHNIK